MLIKLTNAAADFKGTPLAIKKDLIVTVYASPDNKTTFLFVPPHGTWEVSEQYDDVIDTLNK
jgi:hypothetical protein